MSHELLQDLEILFGLALVTVVLFRRLKFPSIIGFLVTGIIAGPHALAFIADTRQVEQMAEIGVVLLLFTIGMEFSLKQLMRIRRLVFWGGGLQLGGTILATAAAAYILPFTWHQGLFFGFLVALSSTAILIKLLMDAGELDTPQGKIALGILIFQDLCVVPLMLVTPFLAGAGSGVAELLLVCLKAAAVVLVAHYGARFLVPWLFSQVVRTRSKELFILTILFIGFGAAWLTAQTGLSLALGAFIAGLAISESEYSHQALSDIIPFRDAFMSLFFISVGMLLDPAILVNYPVAIAVLVSGIILLKGGIAGGAVFGLGVPLRTALIAGLSLAQIGEFSFILAQVGLEHRLLTPELYQIFLAASIATMGLTPLSMKLAPMIADRIVRILPHGLNRGRGRLVRGEKPISMAGHVVVAGFGVNGRNLAQVLKHLQLPHVIIETNPYTVGGEKKRGEKIIFGDASREEVLKHARIDAARIMVIAISDAAASRRIAALARQMNPAIHIIVRTRYLLEVEPLLQLGANEVIPEEFETSVEILARVLRTLLVPLDEIERCVAEVRRDGYGMLRSLSRRHSHAVGISGYLSGAEIGTFRIRNGSVLEGESLREGTIRNRSGATVLVIKRGNEVVPNPDPVWSFQDGDLVLLLGSAEQLAAAGRLFGPEAGRQ